jgi:5-(carboxyamino)imidazole ribonucleotide synthase
MSGLPRRRMRRRAAGEHARPPTSCKSRPLRRARQGYSPWTSRVSLPCALCLHALRRTAGGTCAQRLSYADHVVGRLGILGGGQLGRMTLQAASVLGVDIVIGERFAGSPAARLTDRSIVFTGGWDDAQALDELARLTPVVTLENEFVDASVLRGLERRGCTVLPSPDCVATVQDKFLQKRALARAELPVAQFTDDLDTAEKELGWPLMLKARRDGYDGRGNVLVRSQQELLDAAKRLGRDVYAEQYVTFERELAVIVVRGRDGQTVPYPVVETRQDPLLHICRSVLAPAAVPTEVAERATSVARAAITAVGGVGTFGVELFLLPDGGVLINELAPRPHNSGHYTIEACITSQFSNHVRAVLGLALGSPEMRQPAAAMVNILGTEHAANVDLAAVLKKVPEAYVHLYGKEPRPGRKLGHATALGATTKAALRTANQAADAIKL